MKKPSQFKFNHIKTSSIRSFKDHDHVFFDRSSLEELVKESNADLVEVKLSSTWGSQDNKEIYLSFYEKEKKSVEEFQSENAEYQLELKRQQTQRALTETESRFYSLKKHDRKLEELEVAKNKLQSFIGNDRIPPEKKKEIVAMWQGRVNTLSAILSPEDTTTMTLQAQLKDKIDELRKDLAFQEEVLSLNAKNYEVSQDENESHVCDDDPYHGYDYDDDDDDD